MARQTAKRAAVTELVTTPLQVVTDIQVTTADVLAIGIVEVETRLEEQIKGLTAQLREQEKVVSKAKDRIANAKADRVKDYFADAKKALEDAIKLSGLNLKVSVDVGHGSITTDDVETFHGILQLTGSNYGGTSRTQEFVSTSEQVVLMKELGQANVELGKVREKLVDAKLNLSKLPSLERKHRAQLAKSQLSRSVEGQELLARMQEQTSSDLTRLALPLN